jgi:hypothetical protein
LCIVLEPYIRIVTDNLIVLFSLEYPGLV